MKSAWKWIALFAVLDAVGLLASVPLWNAQFQGIEGYYESGKCSDGHTVYTEIRDGKWYVICPGHKSRNLAGDIVSKGDHWEAVSAHRTEFDIEAARGRVFTTSKKDGVRREEKKLYNPWRLWIPWMLPA